jgi:signal peptidase II
MLATGPLVPLLPALAASLTADQALKGALLVRAARPLVSRSGLLALRPRLTGRTFGGRLGLGPAGLLVAWLLCLLAALLLAPKVGLFGGALAQAALGVAFGGAAGNLADLLRRGRVVDYLQVGPWPAFNLADVAIVSGVIGALIAR